MIPRLYATIGRHRGAGLISCCFFVLAALYGIVNPPFESHDEDQHYLFVKHLADGHGLPVRGVTTMLDETHQAPLYHALAALATFYIDTDDVARVQRPNPSGPMVAEAALADNRNRLRHGPWDAFPWRGAVLASHIARLLSAALGALTVFFTYLMAREMFPSRREIALLAAVAVLANVQFVYLSSAVSNDALIACLGAVSLWLIVRMVRLGPTQRRALLIGLVVGLAALAKASGILLLPVALLALLLSTAQSREWVRGTRCTLWLIPPVMAIAGWWYVRNQVLYQDWSGLRMVYLSGAQRESPLSLWEALPMFDLVLRSFYLPWLWTHFRVPEEIYAVGKAVLSLGALGVLWALTRRLLALSRGATPPEDVPPAPELQRRGVRRPARAIVGDVTFVQVVVVLVWVVLVALALLRYMQESKASESGRFLFPAIAAIYVLLAWGWASLAPRCSQRLLPVALVGPGLAWSLAYPWLFLVPAYAPPALLRPGEVDAAQRRVDVRFGNQIALLGYDLPTREAAPGDTVAISVYWQGWEQVNEDYMVFLHLAEVGGGTVAQRDTYTGLGNFPTSAWRPGLAFRDTYRIQLPAALPAPQVLDVEIGLYLRETDDRLPVARDGRPAGDSLRLGRIKVASRAPLEPAPQIPAEIIFGESLRLDGLTLKPTRPQSAGTLSLTAYWRALQTMASDYTVFVHVVDPGGRRVAQVDEQPKRGRYPTSYWAAGGVVEDQYDLVLPRLDPATYRIVMGLYDARSGLRLKAVSSSIPISDDAALVAEFAVETH